MKRLTLTAPAKINWTLEVLGKRPDGYHEVRTILQAINVYDTITLTTADEISLSVRGATPGFRKHAQESPDRNLAYRAAALLRERAAYDRGAEVRLHKNIPIATGLGGGSSDAASVLRGLRDLWALSLSAEELSSIAAELGSDVPFFLRGGTALATGRGELVEPLPDAPQRHLVLAWPKGRAPAPDKTARMYAALRPEHYSDGAATDRLAGRLRTAEPVRDEDLYNIFEGVLTKVDPKSAELFRRACELGVGRPHLCGSGPAVFVLVDVNDAEKTREVWHAVASVYGSASLATTLRAGEIAVRNA
ncbi:MAG: 4-(cytidine 5'-diphospho)-2-C-methyl-D-erythritol kinase [Dehalococcoidia bacterium]